jgi:hypothetical protein
MAMRRIAILAAGAVAAAALSAGEVAASQPAAQLRGFSCHRAVNPVAREIAVDAVMRPVAGTKRMWLRFELLYRANAGDAWTPRTGGDLGSWKHPGDPTLGQRAGDVWIVNKPVDDLIPAGAYRMRVSFRWAGAGGRVLASTVRSTPTCVQPELRPDLLVKSIAVRASTTQPGYDRYTATIVNAGRTSARRFRVEFTPGGGLAPTYRRIRLLRAHASTQVSFLGPACSSTAASTVTADPDGVIDDFNRSNNTLSAGCGTAPGRQ